ncbi:hypothetical protein BV22DRAFT_1003495 [Leucogyrophana mollusca]|uniref:Uncharacterized protein n=1 Tax=Leucogyrophana mollusca TaxID=85980 RepID=A0ACB8BVL1_9AGAM|nr:hypothetical protein BV22DRAFT_1003495 [Leucogyrophana mollusca]
MPELDSPNARFCEAFAGFTSKSGKESATALIRVLDGIASDLARDEGLRQKIGSEEPSIWSSLRQLWNLFIGPTSDEESAEMGILITSVARFTRNLVAGVPINQKLAYDNEPALRRILHKYSSWSVYQDTDSFVVTRMAVQTLSNIVTSNEELMSRFWKTYMSLPEEQVILIRLLTSPDTRTVLSTMVLVVNCVHENKERCSMLTKAPAGIRICITLLDRMVSLYDAEESSDGGKAFDYGYHLFAHLFDGGFTADLYAHLSVPGEVITPHQTTLLKLLDSHLQSSHSNSIHRQLCPMTSGCFFELSTYAQSAIKQAIASEIPDNADGRDAHLVPKELDLLLPKVCEALVLVTQCIVTITLSSASVRVDDLITGQDLRSVFNNARSEHELLRLLDRFLPRINFGKAVPPPSADNRQSSVAVTDPAGFFYVKRDLVRLLGILCHRDKGVQDRIRDINGIPVIMNMCVVDERNPYLREHAILTLRNLLEGNKENQAVVDSIQPSGRWDDEGVLRETPGATRK